METETLLNNWLKGDTYAENFAADILKLESFESIDPQSPLGGPDGLKDVLCIKNGWKYVAAVYFGTQQNSFSDIKKKFKEDLKGVSDNNADGLVFITNQKITPTERETLIKIATDEKSEIILFHRYNIRVLLDSPAGFAARLKYLGVGMNKEEQLGFFDNQNGYLKDIITDNGDRIIAALAQKIDNINCCGESSRKDKINFVLNPTQMTMSTMDLYSEKPAKSDKSKIPIPDRLSSTRTIDSAQLKLIHSAILFDTPVKKLGEFRTSTVWIGSSNTKLNEATFVPPPPEEVPKLTQELLSNWRTQYESIEQGDKDLKISEITRFHFEFLRIHPFADGNGRIARYILMLQANELLNLSFRIILDDSKAYFRALDSAHNGDLQPLQNIISQAIFGSS